MTTFRLIEKRWEKSKGFYRSIITMIDNIYTLLPRYVKTSIEPLSESSEWLPLFETDLELNHQSFTLTIFPVRIEDQTGKWKSVYPGPLEEKIENSLRRLAVPGNINFNTRKHTLVFSIHQLLDQLNRDKLEKKLSRYEAETGLKILNKTSYELRGEDGEFDFRPFTRMASIQKKNQKFYLIEFSAFFFSRTGLFDFSFPDFIKGASH